MMQKEWEEAEENRQPVLSIVKASNEVTKKIKLQNSSLLLNDSMPWNEESDNQAGYDGELTKMTFNHVMHSDAFKIK